MHNKVPDTKIDSVYIDSMKRCNTTQHSHCDLQSNDHCNFTEITLYLHVIALTVNNVNILVKMHCDYPWKLHYNNTVNYREIAL